FFQAEDGIRYRTVTGVQTCALPILILGAIQMFALALMGEYIGRLYNEAKGRPLYIVQDIAGGERRSEARLGYLADASANSDKPRSEERRVGKEGRVRVAGYAVHKRT